MCLQYILQCFVMYIFNEKDVGMELFFLIYEMCVQRQHISGHRSSFPWKVLEMFFLLFNIVSILVYSVSCSWLLHPLLCPCLNPFKLYNQKRNEEQKNCWKQSFCIDFFLFKLHFQKFPNFFRFCSSSIPRFVNNNNNVRGGGIFPPFLHLFLHLFFQ